LREAGLSIEVGLESDRISEQLAPYIHHRMTGRPYVICKIAASLDGGIAAVDGSSRWITGTAARTDAHRLRAESDAIIVGAGTVRADDPALTVRHVEGRDPLRVVLGRPPASARVHPCLEWTGGLGALLERLGGRGVVQALVEGGASVLRSFHDQGLVDRYVVYLAPALFGGRDKIPMLEGPSASSMDAIWRGEFREVQLLGADLRLDMTPLERASTKIKGQFVD
jgi:diaminohydroxyphosphoribosylaminopyrimidine deaminase/5-amino-6-(5-phosphoribosylamino)uracil reductase